MTSAPHQFFVWTLFQQLMHRNFAIGPEEYGAALRALRLGFGWSSRQALKELLTALWARSNQERAVVSSLFDQYVVDDWDAGPTARAPLHGLQGGTDGDTPIGPEGSEGVTSAVGSGQSESTPTSPAPLVAATAPAGRLPPLNIEDLPRQPYSHVFLPQFPVSYRTVVQTWRRLRRPVREGAATELDVEATVLRRSHAGVPSPPVLRPRRRNNARLLILVDRKGSMAPFHLYVEDVCSAISEAGRLQQVAVFHFHDVPLEGVDPAVLQALEGQVFPSLDPILGEIPAVTSGDLFEDAMLLQPQPAEQVLRRWASGASIAIISDAGAARGRYDVLRLLDTLATLNGLKTFTPRIVWLNPLAPETWTRTTAGQIARHVPMFPLDRDGMHRAVNVLRGQPFMVERPLPPARSPGEIAAAEGGAAS